MNLAIFDIDGTLADTNDVDSRCYVRALKEVFGIDATGLDWGNYTSVTDIGITEDVFHEEFGRHPDSDEIQKLQAFLIALFEEEHAADPISFRPIPGAVRLLGELRNNADWTIALATGCWQVSAEMKLRAAGVDVSDLPLACCEVGRDRESIVNRAIELATQAASVQPKGIVSIGDGTWDVETASRLGVGFFGVRVRGDVDTLRTLGAEHVVTDFQTVAVSDLLRAIR